MAGAAAGLLPGALEALLLKEHVVTFAKVTGFGYTRIVGEMTKLGIRIGRNAVQIILKEEAMAPGGGFELTTFGSGGQQTIELICGEERLKLV